MVINHVSGTRPEMILQVVVPALWVDETDQNQGAFWEQSKMWGTFFWGWEKRRSTQLPFLKEGFWSSGRWRKNPENPLTHHDQQEHKSLSGGFWYVFSIFNLLGKFYLGRSSCLTNIFHMGWNQHPRAGFWKEYHGKGSLNFHSLILGV